MCVCGLKHLLGRNPRAADTPPSLIHAHNSPGTATNMNLTEGERAQSLQQGGYFHKRAAHRLCTGTKEGGVGVGGGSFFKRENGGTC